MGAVQDVVWLLLCNPLRVYEQLSLKDLLEGREETRHSDRNHMKAHSSTTKCGHAPHLHQLHCNLVDFSVGVRCLEEYQVQKCHYITLVVPAIKERDK